MAMRHRTVSGTIRYTSKKPELMDQERGREVFCFTHHGDGSMIMRARCEIEEPDPEVLRDIGKDSKTVEAGTFECRHYRYIDDIGPGMGGVTHPTYDMWVTDDDDAIVVYGSIDGSMMNRYELVTLDR